MYLNKNFIHLGLYSRRGQKNPDAKKVTRPSTGDGKAATVIPA